MCTCPPHVNNAIPEEYRRIVDGLFPPQGYPAGEGPAIDAAAAFAEILGIGSDYKHLLTVNRTDKKMRQFLGHFQNNLDLLIQKTWVEKAEESRKEKLQSVIPGFIAGIERGDYRKALTEFSAILKELAYLFFGVQSYKEDFTEYTLRIDTQMGLFWWYGGQIGGLQQSENDSREPVSEWLWAVLLIGICYLTNF
jgi:hypothetical protein